MNILVISSKYPPEYSGSGHRCHNTYIRLKSKYNIDYKVLCSSITYNNCENYNYDGVDVYRIAKKYQQNNRFRTKINIIDTLFKKITNLINILSESTSTWLYLIKNFRWLDAIHVFGNVTVTSTAISFAKITKKPIIIEVVNLVEKIRYYEPRVISLIWGSGYPKHAKLIAISNALSDACKAAGIKNENIWCRPNPIDERKFNAKISRRDIENVGTNSINENEKIILHLAKFLPRKKQDFMIDVMKYLPTNYKLVLAGPLVKNGPLAKRDLQYFKLIEDKVAKYRFEERITIIPKFIKHPQNLIINSDIFVLPSIWEGLGTPVLESLACGVPVIANNIPGVFDQWIKDGINGFICDLEPELWANKIEQTISIERDTMVSASKEILNIASTKVIDEKYYQLINQTVIQNKNFENKSL